MNNEYRSVSYHFQVYYKAMSEAVTKAKAKYPDLVPSGWRIDKISREEYVKNTSSNIKLVDELVNLTEQKKKWRASRKNKLHNRKKVV